MKFLISTYATVSILIAAYVVLALGLPELPVIAFLYGLVVTIAAIFLLYEIKASRAKAKAPRSPSLRPLHKRLREALEQSQS